MSVVVWIGVAVLGGGSSLLRFRVAEAVQRRAGGIFPWGTLAVNVSGSLALGVVFGLGVTGDALVLLGTAVLGSYTTFSTWMVETQRLGEERQRRLVLANVVLSLAAGLAAVAAGWAVGAAL
jgi:CrcB protein